MYGPAKADRNQSQGKVIANDHHKLEFWMTSYYSATPFLGQISSKQHCWQYGCVRAVQTARP